MTSPFLSTLDPKAPQDLIDMAHRHASCCQAPASQGADLTKGWLTLQDATIAGSMNPVFDGEADAYLAPRQPSWVGTVHCLCHPRHQWRAGGRSNRRRPLWRRRG